MLTPRDYQLECLAAIKKAYLAGVTRQAIVMATGTGKSVVFSNIPKAIGLTKRGFLLVHRLELVEQAARHFAAANPRLKIGIEMAGTTADPATDDIIIASTASIGQTGEGFTKRIQKFDPDKTGLVVGDEGHHLTSSINKNILKYLRVLKGEDDEDKSILLCILTATPSRTDGVGLETIVDEIVFNRGIREMIDAGWLAPIKAMRVETSVDLTGIKVQHGDFAAGELEKRVNTPERNRIICEKYLELSPELRPAIAFTVDIKHSHDLCICLRQMGINALPVSGDTPKDERHRLLEAHASGEIKVLASCQVYGEGVDIVHAEVGLMTCPTKSHLKFAQQIGRLTRPNPSPEAVWAGERRIKDAAIIVDFVDNSLKHQLCSVPTLFGLSSSFDAKGESITAALSAIEAAQEKFKQLRLDSFRDLRELQSVIQTIDLLKPPSIPEDLRGLSDMAWTSGAAGSYNLVGQSFHFSIRQNQLGQYEMAQHAAGMRQLMATFPALAPAIRSADAHVPVQERQLVSAEARWRKERPTPKQIKLLSSLDRSMYRKFGSFGEFSAFVSERFSRGEVSGMISQKGGNKTWTVKR